MAPGLNANLYELMAGADDPKVYVSALILRPKREVLIVKGSEPPFTGLWHLPGGKLRGGMAMADMLEERLAAQLGVSPRVARSGKIECVTNCWLPNPDGSGTYVVEICLRAEIDPFGQGPACGVGVAEWRFCDAAALHKLRQRRGASFAPSCWDICAKTLDIGNREEYA